MKLDVLVFPESVGRTPSAEPVINGLAEAESGEDKTRTSSNINGARRVSDAHRI
ncbi:MAG: hypothetical protein NTU49_08640 [Gammaproteobacteria bacterium]|nr:hypothetical protein [Gammaproteobacteria bacterium]